MDWTTDTLVLVGATVLVALGQILVVVTTRPRPRSVLEVIWIALPVIGVTALVVAAWQTVT